MDNMETTCARLRFWKLALVITLAETFMTQIHIFMMY